VPRSGNGGSQIDSAIITEKWGGQVHIEKVVCACWLDSLQLQDCRIIPCGHCKPYQWPKTTAIHRWLDA
jgi:hypothetical protein